jgi:membrane dipeptidase
MQAPTSSDLSVTQHPLIVDAHLDIAYNVLYKKRDYRLAAHSTRELEVDSDREKQSGQCTVGLPDLIRGRVGLVFGTIFTEPASHTISDDLPVYRDDQEAHKLGMGQLDFYRRWADDDPHVRLVTTQHDLEDVCRGWRMARGETSPHTSRSSLHQIGIVPLMEGADPIREPKELELWYEKGLRIVGLAWDTTRYSGGTWKGGRLPKLGRELLDVMAQFNMILDVSHMSHESLFEALDVFEGKHVIASHSNPHRFVPTPRHLPDRAIEQIAERGGVIGVVLYNRFLKKDWNGKKEDVTLDDVVRMIDHICQLTGSANHVGIGSDYDGGLGYNEIPRELDTVRDHYKIGNELLNRGYDPQHVEQIMCRNWLRVLREALPN